MQGETDLGVLVAIAISIGRQGVPGIDVEPIFAAWRAHYPQDAMGPIGLALCWFRHGRQDEAIAILRREGVTAQSRAEQARETLRDLTGAAPELAPVGGDLPFGAALPTRVRP